MPGAVAGEAVNHIRAVYEVKTINIIIVYSVDRAASMIKRLLFNRNFRGGFSLVLRENPGAVRHELCGLFEIGDKEMPLPGFCPCSGILGLLMRFYIFFTARSNPVSVSTKWYGSYSP